jgi:hypothetical protein
VLSGALAGPLPQAAVVQLTPRPHALRPLAGAAYLLGVPLLGAALPAAARATAAAAAAALALAAPPRAEAAPASPLHAALLNITHDAGRAADLVHEFILLEGDAALQQRFLAFLSLKAASSYTRVDQRLSWVLWVYSTLWMPLLIVLCLLRSARGGSSSGGEAAARQRGALQANAPPPVSAPLRHAASLPAARGGAGGGGAVGGDPDGGIVLRRAATVVAASRRANGGSRAAVRPGADGLPSCDGGARDLAADTGGALTVDQVQRAAAALAGAPWQGGGALKAARSASLRPVFEL